MKKIIFILGALISSLAYSVDGYKDVKFNISTKEFLDKKLCSFKKGTSPDVGAVVYVCDDFKFAGKQVAASAFFIDDKFFRFAILPDVSQVESIAQLLKNKYGNPIEQSSMEELKMVDMFPNRQAQMYFDNYTVILRVGSREDMKQYAVVIYTRADYLRVIRKKQKAKLGDDL